MKAQPLGLVPPTFVMRTDDSTKTEARGGQRRTNWNTMIQHSRKGSELMSTVAFPCLNQPWHSYLSRCLQTMRES